MDKGRFFRNFLRDKGVASVTPSSRFSVKRLCRKIDFSKKNIIVEYGPGSGVFSRYILSKMSSDSKLILIETNKDFVNQLRSIDGSRLYVFHDSAENIQEVLKKCNEEKADYIISGIPFSFLSQEAKRGILTQTKGCLSDEGKFLIYQISPLIKKHLKKNFSKVHYEIELLNIPPLSMFEAK